MRPAAEPPLSESLAPYGADKFQLMQFPPLPFPRVFSQGRAQLAQGFLQEARKSKSQHPMTIILQGRAQLLQGGLNQARKTFNAALKVAPGDRRAHLGLAEVYTKKRQKAKAIQALLKVYSADADNLQAKRLLFKLNY